MAIFTPAAKIGVLTEDNTLYIGEVSCVDETRGIRLTLLDDEMGLFNGHDLFLPWSQIRRAWICTDEHEVGRFVHEMEGMTGGG